MRELTAHFAHRVPAICGINNTRTAKRILQNRQSCGLRILQISRWLKILHNLSRRLLHHIADDCEARLASRDGRSAAENLIRQHLRVLGVCDFGVLPAHKVVDLSCGHGVPGGRGTQPKSHGYHTRESAPGSRTGALCAGGRAGGRSRAIPNLRHHVLELFRQDGFCPHSAQVSARAQTSRGPYGVAGASRARGTAHLAKMTTYFRKKARRASCTRPDSPRNCAARARSFLPAWGHSW